MPGVSNAVFLSYASEDAEAAERIATALRAAGVEVWVDKSELRGGDAWDHQIRDHIHDCRLFIPVISANSERRDEGYFRREWRLAVERAGDMAERKAFLVPVVIDGTLERTISVPEKFHGVQWTRLPGGETPPAFVERVQRLLSPEAATMTRPTASAASSAAPVSGTSVRVTSSSKPLLLGIAVVVVAALTYLGVTKLGILKHAPTAAPAALAAPSAAAPAAFNPPPHSIAVLPFVNMSGDKEQEYFSDGLTEEILNSLARVNALQVSARTSSFAFKGKDVDISTIAHKLNVASILEGSMRRAGKTVRITAQLNNAITGFHLWSETYDRDLSNVLQLQTEIANAVANALKVSLLGDVATKVEMGGTRNPAALDAYLRASSAYWTGTGEEAYQAAIAAYGEAIRLDPSYALAYADRSFVLADFGQGSAKGAAIRDFLNKAQVDAVKAIGLAPELGEGHLALAAVYQLNLEFPQANREYQRALELAPGNAKVLIRYGLFASLIGHHEAGLAAAHRSVTLDPLNPWYRVWLGAALSNAGRYGEATAAYKEALALAPKNGDVIGQAGAWLGDAYYHSGDYQNARAACESANSDIDGFFCLAVTYDKLGRHADAETMLSKLRALLGNDHPVTYSEIYAQWGNSERALEWLETAMRQRDPNLAEVKSSQFLDPLRSEPRFQAIERELKFPSN
jgi:TolB-like protein/Tfp pilus assembly protein PilF